MPRNNFRGISFLRLVAIPIRFELTISSLTGRRVKPLHHGTAWRYEPPLLRVRRVPLVSQQHKNRHRLFCKGLAVIAADPLVTDFDFARGGDHNGRDLVAAGQPFDLGPLIGLF